MCGSYSKVFAKLLGVPISILPRQTLTRGKNETGPLVLFTAPQLPWGERICVVYEWFLA